MLELLKKFFVALRRRASGAWTNQETEDRLKVSQPPWCSANAAPINHDTIPVSLSASQPLSPQPRAAGTNYPSMEGVTHDNEKPMTQGEMMKGLDTVTRRYARPIAGKYTVEQLKAQVGKETGVIFIAVPIEWVAGGNTTGNRQQIANRVGPLLGQAICCRVGTYGGTSKPTGTVSILIQQLSEEGAVRLGRGFLRLTGKDGVSTRNGVAVHEKHSLTACNFTPPRMTPPLLSEVRTHTHTTHHSSPSGWMIGEKDWGSHKAMKAAAAEAVAK